MFPTVQVTRRILVNSNSLEHALFEKLRAVCELRKFFLGICVETNMIGFGLSEAQCTPSQPLSASGYSTSPRLSKVR